MVFQEMFILRSHRPQQNQFFFLNNILISEQEDGEESSQCLLDSEKMNNKLTTVVIVAIAICCSCYPASVLSGGYSVAYHYNSSAPDDPWIRTPYTQTHHYNRRIDPPTVINNDDEDTTVVPIDDNDDGEEESSAATTLFINSVHAIAANVSQNLTIHDTKVVWSPFAVVSAINALNSDTGSSNSNSSVILGNGLDSATTYIRSLSPALNVTLINGAYTHDAALKLNSSRLTLTLLSNTSDINDVLQHAFLNLTNTLPPPEINTTTKSAAAGAAGPLLTTPPAPQNNHPHSQNNNRLLVPGNLTTYVLTSLGLESSWAVPFHPRYAKKSKFFLNSTHIVKTKFLNNIAFIKFANLSLGSYDNSSSSSVVVSASAAAIPLKDVHKTYLIVVKPNGHDDIEKLSAVLDSPGMDFVGEVFGKLRTKRVQLSVPKINIDSQFVLPLTPTTSMLHISSLKLTYSGLSHNFAPPPQSPQQSKSPSPSVRFTRLRRRKDDIRLKINSPFLFYIYDASISGILLSGLVLNPLDDPHQQQQPSPSLIAPPLPPPLQTLKESSNRFCMDLFQFSRRRASIYDNIFVPCLQSFKATLKDKDSVDMVAALEALTVGSSRVNESTLQFSFPNYKSQVKKFYSDEVNYVNASYVELEVSKVKYLSYPALDMKVMRLKVPSTQSQFLYVLLPNERSGVGVVEEGLDVNNNAGSGGRGGIRFQSLLCQMRDIHRRIRIPLTNIRYQRVKQDLREFTNSSLLSSDFVLPDSVAFSAESQDNSNSSSSSVAGAMELLPSYLATLANGGAGSERIARKTGSSSGGKRRYKKMYVDRPFMFVLTEEVNSRGALIAVGRVVVPSTAASVVDVTTTTTTAASTVDSDSAESSSGSASKETSSEENSSSSSSTENSVEKYTFAKYSPI